MKTTLLDSIWQEGRDFLGVRYPIMCGAMTWISDTTLVKAVNDQGGFASLAAGNMPGDVLAEEIAKCSAAVKTPFAVNLVTIAPNFPAHKEAVLASDVPIVIFAGNFPKRNDVVEMKAAGKKVLSFASTDSIADQMVRFGVDGLILEGFGVAKTLLHAVADAVAVVLGLDDGNGEIGGVVEDVVGALVLAPGVQLAADDDAAPGEADLLAHLRGEIPAGTPQGRGDVLRADVAFREVLLVLHLGFRRVMASASMCRASYDGRVAVGSSATGLLPIFNGW